MSIADNSTSITVSWSAPAGVITEYRLQCSGGNQIINWFVKSSQLTTTLSGLLYHTLTTPVTSLLTTVLEEDLQQLPV